MEWILEANISAGPQNPRFRKSDATESCQWPRSASLVPGADHDVRDRRALQQLVERNLRHRLAGFLRRLIERVHNRIEVFLRHLRPKIGRLVEARTRR